MCLTRRFLSRLFIPLLQFQSVAHRLQENVCVRCPRVALHFLKLLFHRTQSRRDSHALIRVQAHRRTRRQTSFERGRRPVGTQLSLGRGRETDQRKQEEDTRSHRIGSM